VSAVARAGTALGPSDWGRAIVPAAGWLLVMLALPFAEWVGGVPARTAGVVLAVLLLSATVLVLLVRSAGRRAALRMAGGIVVLAWVAEAVGAATDLPFGPYAYTDLLQPQLAGVPIVIPLAWLMGLPPAWAVAARITGGTGGLAFVLVSAGAMTAWDLFLDPQMVGEGYWTWPGGGAYRGIPLGNYAGWLLTSAGVMLLLERVLPPRRASRAAVAQYAVVAAMQTVGFAAFFGDAVVAAAGGAAMLPVAVAAVVRVRRTVQ